MNLDDIMTAGSLIVNVALGVVVCRNTLSNQENGERIRIFEIMQSRGMLPTAQDLDKVLIAEQREAERQIEQAARQKSLPAPRQGRPQRNVTKSPAGYDPNEESYVDDTQPMLPQGRRRAGTPARTTDTVKTARAPYGQRRQYGYVYEDEQ